MDLSILNIASGKFNPLGIEELKRYFLVNLDIMYYSVSTPEEVEKAFDRWSKTERTINYCNEDVFKFLERTRIQFDKICIYRFLEHVQKTDVLYFIYLMSTALKIGGTIDCIVPNYKILAKRILEEDPFSKDFENEDIITTFELLNDVNNPHASVWTKDRANFFFTYEKRFEITHIDENFKFDGRDLYLRFKAKRIK
jgi:predicted SAM-dependent methyltransferase